MHSNPRMCILLQTEFSKVQNTCASKSSSQLLMARAEFGSMLSDFPPLSYLTCRQPHSIQCPGDARLVLTLLLSHSREKSLSLGVERADIRILSQEKLCLAYVSFWKDEPLSLVSNLVLIIYNKSACPLYSPLLSQGIDENGGFFSSLGTEVLAIILSPAKKPWGTPEPTGINVLQLQKQIYLTRRWGQDRA